MLSLYTLWCLSICLESKHFVMGNSWDGYDDWDKICFPQLGDLVLCCHPRLRLTNGVQGYESSNYWEGNLDCWNRVRSFRRCCDPAFAMSGEDLPLGAPEGKIGSELEQTTFGRGTWLGKNASSFPEFIKARVVYIMDDTAFDTFRSAIDDGFRLANDGFYKKYDEDTDQMAALLNHSDLGHALVNAVLPRVAAKVDSVGGPLKFRMGEWGLTSSDVFNMVFKLMLILESFLDFFPFPNMKPLPTVQDILDGPSKAMLFAEWDIVEVGAGPGIHAATLVEAMGSRSYSIVDLPTQQALQYKFLSRVFGQGFVNRTFSFVPCCIVPPVNRILPTYDLFISTYAFSELTESLREIYFYNFILHSKRGFIIDNHEDIHNERSDAYWTLDPKLDVGGGADKGAYFTGLDLLWRLQDYGFDVNIVPKHRFLKQQLHRSRTVLITWGSTAWSGFNVANNKIRMALAEA